MQERDRIALELRAALDGDPWHGSPVFQILKGLDHHGALARPISGAHNPWELVLHMTAWAREAARRLAGHSPGVPLEGDWPEVRETTAETWRAAVEDLRRSHEELLGALSAFPEERLDERIGGERNTSQGTGVSWEMMLHGVSQHDAYHAGQIALIRKGLSATG
jgi:uncharacterized damage-inducible protein DinB